MRFPRQARVFRGQLDAAPVAGMVFLLLMFIQLGSLLHLPGVLVHLDNPAAVIRYASDGLFHFGARTYKETETNELRAALQHSQAGPPFDFRADPGVSPKLAAQAGNVVNSIFQIHLAHGATNLLGTEDPTVVVAVNFLGQYFYDYRNVGERELQAELEKQVQAAGRESKEMTLTVAADEQVNWSAVERLTELARAAGIKKTVWAERLEQPPPSFVKPAP